MTIKFSCNLSGETTPLKHAWEHTVGSSRALLASRADWQAQIVMMIENYRSGFLWELMRKCPYIVTGLKRAGFTGGWYMSANRCDRYTRIT